VEYKTSVGVGKHWYVFHLQSDQAGVTTKNKLISTLISTKGIDPLLGRAKLGLGRLRLIKGLVCHAETPWEDVWTLLFYENGNVAVQIE